MKAVYPDLGTIRFASIADGRANAVFRDYDDLVNILGRLACAVVWDFNQCLIAAGND